MDRMLILFAIASIIVVYPSIASPALGFKINTTPPMSKCPQLPKLDILPGSGWCNLRNIPMAQVFASTYNLCKTTLDEKFLIPDSVTVIPVRESSVLLFSEIISSSSNYTSITSKSININAGLSGDSFSISGTYGEDFKDMKQKMVDDKSIVTRVSGTYTLYIVDMPSTSDIDQELRSRLYPVFNALEANQTRLASLLLEMIIRDFGTHVVNRVVAGGILLKEDLITKHYAMEYADQQHVIKASASADFFDAFGFDASYKTKTDVSTLTKYSDAKTSSKVRTIGGVFYKANGTSSSGVNPWIDSLSFYPVAIDRGGSPLHFIITPEAFPDVPLHTLSIASVKFEKAILDFYNYNKRFGCTDDDSPGFDFPANVPKPCAANTYNLTFGGVFQDCVSELTDAGDLCSSYNLRVANPVTKGMSCQPNFVAVPITSSSVHYEYSWEERVWFHTNTHWRYSRSTYTAYWCAAQTNLVANTGALFGGLFTSKMPNPLTEDRTCPPTYLDMKVLGDLHICVGYDYEFGYKFSMDFGGLFSCLNGNPLYTDGNPQPSFKFVQGGSTYPKACPKGFTQHTAYIFEDCLINYCLAAGSFKTHGGIPIVLPPFLSMDILFTNVSFPPDLGLEVQKGDSDVLSGLAIGGIIAGTLVASVVLIFIVGLAIKQQRRRANARLNGEGVMTALIPEDNVGGYAQL